MILAPTLPHPSLPYPPHPNSTHPPHLIHPYPTHPTPAHLLYQEQVLSVDCLSKNPDQEKREGVKHYILKVFIVPSGFNCHLLFTPLWLCVRYLLLSADYCTTVININDNTRTLSKISNQVNLILVH